MTAETDILDRFRRRARTWLQANAARAGDSERSGGATLEESKRFQAALHDAGFAGITWPIEYGGQGLSQRYQLAFNAEAREFDLPTIPFMIGLGMCGPTLLDLGTDEQKNRYIRPLLRGDAACVEPGPGGPPGRGPQFRAGRGADLAGAGCGRRQARHRP